MNIIFYVLAEFAAAVLIGLFFRKRIGMFVHVKGRSMMDTLNNGDWLFVRRLRRKEQLRRFDIVVCRFKDQKELFLKRVIALPGETVSMENDVVCIDGEPLTEEFPRRRCLRKIEPITMDPDEYFVLGDNRPVSRDSRRLGPVHREDILGRTTAVLFPWKMHRRIH